MGPTYNAPYAGNCSDPARRRIVIRDGVLAIQGGHDLNVSVGRAAVHVGCTTFTREAWRFLQQEVDALLAAAKF